MNIKRAKEEIKDAIDAYLAKDSHGNYCIPEIRQRPILLIGPPGIGKTQIMSQIAQEKQVGLVAYTITHHTRQSAIGLPFISQKNYGGKEYSVTEYTMSEIVASIYNRIEETGLKEGILFIDEINCVSETLAPTMLQFLQCKTFGNHRIPAGWIIVTAGNPPEYNKSVREFDLATLDRIKKIDVEADFEVWKEYAYRVDMHPAVISYLNAKPSHFYQIETSVDGRMFATPRGWEDLSSLIRVYESIGKTVDREVTIQYIQHPKIAKDFANYLELYYKYQTDYRVEDILRGHRDEKSMHQIAAAPFDEKLSVISLLLAHLGSAFKQACGKEQFLELLLKQISSWKAQLEEESTEDTVTAEESTEQTGTHLPAELLKKIEKALSDDRENRKKTELLTREEDYLLQDVLKELEGYEMLLEKDHLSEPEEAIASVRAEFGKQRSLYEASEEEAQAFLENAFDFMEEVFGDSQEMVMFLTELNSGYYSVKFLEEHECERYYRYNERLLFQEREENLRRRIRNR